MFTVKKTFFDRSTLLKHQKNVHGKENGNRVSCMVPSCNLKFFHIDSLVNHLITVHNADIDIQNLEFENIDAFQKYKEEESLKQIHDMLCIKANKD